MDDLEDPSAGLWDEEEVAEERRAAHIEGLKEALEIVERKCLTQEISGVANTIRARISDLEKS
jgi:hypothetical protein